MRVRVFESKNKHFKVAFLVKNELGTVELESNFEKY